MNAPDREEAATLLPDERKIAIVEDKRLPNTINITIVKEDHTVGNLIRTQILKAEETRFAGYRMPHPLENILQMKVQIEPDEGRVLEPIQTVKEATYARIIELCQIKKEFNNSLMAFKERRDQDFNRY